MARNSAAHWLLAADPGRYKSWRGPDGEVRPVRWWWGWLGWWKWLWVVVVVFSWGKREKFGLKTVRCQLKAWQVGILASWHPGKVVGWQCVVQEVVRFVRGYVYFCYDIAMGMER